MLRATIDIFTNSILHFGYFLFSHHLLLSPVFRHSFLIANMKYSFFFLNGPHVAAIKKLAEPPRSYFISPQSLLSLACPAAAPALTEYATMFSRLINLMYHEHEVILHDARIASSLENSWETNAPEYQTGMSGLLDFFRNIRCCSGCFSGRFFIHQTNHYFSLCILSVICLLLSIYG